LREVEYLRGEIVGSSELALEALRDLESGEPAALAAAIRKMGAIAAKGIKLMRAEVGRKIHKIPPR
jgi:hypothetical protein